MEPHKSNSVLVTSSKDKIFQCFVTNFTCNEGVREGEGDDMKKHEEMIRCFVCMKNFEEEWEEKKNL